MILIQVVNLMKARESALISQFYLENAGIIGYKGVASRRFTHARHLNPLRTY